METVEVSSSNFFDKLARSSDVSIMPEGVQKYAPDNITGRKMKSNTMDGLSLARQWYRICCDSHGNQCHDRQSLGTRPTRLLDLADSPPRLCLGQELDRDSKYADLSTCPRSLMICFVGIILFANPAICFPCLSGQLSLFKFLGWAITDFCRRSLLGIASICHSAKGQSPAVSRQDSRRSTTKDVP